MRSEKEDQVPVGGTGRGRGDSSATPVIWLASFPKSGNTWLRFLLARLLFGPVADSADLETMIPDSHVPISAGSASECRRHRGNLLLKTHWTSDTAGVRARRTVRVIYLVRDPRDVFASLARYFEATKPPARDRLLAAFVESGGSTPEFLGHGFGTWRRHVESWLVDAARQVPVHLVRYEDLRARPREELRRLAAALDRETDDAELEACVEESRIERLRAIERRDMAAGVGVFGRLAGLRGRGFTFFPCGRVGSHRELLRPHELRLLVPLFEPWLGELGYGARETGDRPRRTATGPGITPPAGARPAADR